MTAVLLIAGLAAVVWGMTFVLRGSLMAGCLIYLLLANCFGIHFLQFSIGPTTVSLDRLFLVFLLGTYIVQRRLGLAEPKPLSKVDLGLMAFMALLVGSTMVGKWLGLNDHLRSADSDTGAIVQHLINGYLIPFTLYWIVRQSPLTERNVTMAHAALACFGIYLAITGLAEFTGQWWLVFPKYIADPLVGLHFGRARGPMVQSVSFGLYLGVCLLSCWLWRFRLGRVGQLLLLLTVPMFLAAVFCSHTRSIWMGVGLGLMIVLAFTLHGAWRPLVLGSIVAAGLMVAIVKKDAIMSLERGDNSASQTLQSAGARKIFVYVSWKMFLDRPLLGFGFGQFPEAKLPYLNDRTTELQLQMIREWVHHNNYLSLLTDTGLIGLGLFIFILLSWITIAWRNARSRRLPAWVRAHNVVFLGGLAIYAVQLMGHELSYTPLDNSLMFLLAGIAVGLHAAIQRPRVESQTEEQRSHHAQPAALLTAS